MPSKQLESVASLMSMTTGVATPFTIEKSSHSSEASSSKASSSATSLRQHVELPEAPRFRSRRVKRDEIELPWLDKKHPRDKFTWILPVVGLVFGFAMTGLICYFRLSGVPHNSYCPVLTENFDSGTLDSNVWTKDVSLSGFGNGQFEETTDTTENAFIQDGNLVIKPTLQETALMDDGQTLNLFGQGCSGNWTDCVATSNITNGSIINPVKSARLTTLGKKSIKYGRVEVVAKMPKGDWMWPAIWMLPVNSTYGAWPASGEIDIVESRGNNASYSEGGFEEVRTSLHWGPDSTEDRYKMTTGVATTQHSTYADGFHTFGLEWSEKYLFTWVDGRLHQIYYGKFQKSFWNKGEFSDAVNPWAGGSVSTPFDQDFYLILNVAVGGTNGYFPDAQGKPWVDTSDIAKRQFWNARNQWYPTWQKSGEMVVQSVKMWQQKGYNGC